MLYTHNDSLSHLNSHLLCNYIRCVEGEAVVNKDNDEKLLAAFSDLMRATCVCCVRLHMYLCASGALTCS